MAGRICLNMIVRNEAHVIRRCLKRVEPFIDSWAIVDTGSTDGTQELIREELTGVPGSLHERPWRNFGHNRSEALELARASGAEYAFVIDADEELVVPEGFRWPESGADSYQMLQASGDNRFYRTQLMRLALPWHYAGVLHEVAVCNGAEPAQRIEDTVTYGRFDSARNKQPIDKYRNDCRVLHQALEEEPNNARYVYYLAQSYRDSGENLKAEHYYRKRSEMGGWAEEIWSSLFQIGRMREQMNRPAAQIFEAHLGAFDFRPSRAEPLVALAQYCRTQKRYGSCQAFARAALDIPKPEDILFLDSSCYEWRALDEYAVGSYWVGQFDKCLSASEQLLDAGSGLPEAQRERVKENQRFALQKLGRD